MKQFTDDLVFSKPGEPPYTLGGLLGDLGVFTASREAQRTAVTEWLKTHEPTSRFMRDELRDRGWLAAGDRHAA